LNKFDLITPSILNIISTLNPLLCELQVLFLMADLLYISENYIRNPYKKRKAGTL